MKKLLAVWCGLCLSALPAFADEEFVVKEGQARAEIVIAEKPARSTRLAAHELRRCVEKITGARLSIVTAPSGKAPVRIFVGRSPHTDQLKVKADDLQHGAYRIVSGADWLVLIGDDADFTPIEPWARNNDDVKSGKLQNSWNKITGEKWGVPTPGLYRNRLSLAGDTGLPDVTKPAGKLPPLELWDFDERGSFNAVCGFLRSLGVRWLAPGAIGEFVPVTTSIALPKIDQTVRPDFPMRRFNFPFAVVGEDQALWAMRLGLRNPANIQTAHGLETMTNRSAILTDHPEWFALYGGKRHVEPGLRLHQLCYSSEDLFQHTVRYVRAQFDHFKDDVVSVMPPDGYTAMCQCKLCEGRDTPQRDENGRLSDYVWDFVNRVAREVRKTHPDKKVLCCAYGVYTLPPLKIDKLEPNVIVSIVGGRRPFSNNPRQQEECRKLREAWTAKTHNPIIVFENYPFTDRGWYLPSFAVHGLGNSVKATQGVSQGEDIWLSLMWPPNKSGMGLNHFMVYFTARSYWGGSGQDIDKLFREYCQLFYGPAEKEMHTFFSYCESHWQDMEKDKAKTERALELFAAAQARADKSSIHGKRLALIDEFLKGLRNKRTQLAQKRGPVPALRLVGPPQGKIVIDGKLDDEPWQTCPVSATGQLAELQTGSTPILPTTFKVAWIGNDLYFAIRCAERKGEKLNIATTKREDQAIWYGDVVEIQLATESHSYYQIAVNPAGALIDLDRGVPHNAWFGWDAQAQVATHVADDHWTVEIRIPVTQDENDPLHQVIGRRPTQSLPWFINVCRQRIRENGSEYSAFSPTATDGFHEVMKFAHFYDGNSHRFDADANVTDYVLASRAAKGLMLKGKHAEALKIYLALADGKVTDLQKSRALAQAADCACSASDFAQADKLVERIPIKAIARTAHMHRLLAQRKAPDVIARFGAEDIAAWPFWQTGAGYFARGRAYVLTGAAKQAESDLSRALDWTTEPRLRQNIALALGNNREHFLRDDKGAFAAYRLIVKPKTRLGGADEFNAVQGMARILTRSAKFDDALATLHLVDIDKLQGHWRGSMLLALGDALTAAGRTPDAENAYRAVLTDRTTEPGHRKVAEKRLQQKQGG